MHKPFAILVAGLIAVLCTAPAANGQIKDAAAIDFNRDVRPILSDRCFKCHGFDQQARKAGLRLDTWEGLTGNLEGRHPVVPGDPDRSEVIRHVESTEPKFVMPPPSSGLTTTVEERALLRQWIAEGAAFAPHWAFTTPVEPALPAVTTDAHIRNDIDRFVIAELARHGLEPSPQASPETLIRRLSLDLTGLPPSPEEVDAFLADTAPDAYERLVDRLLGSPHFGERLALVWLDAARYADTNGFHHDNIRTAWPYRDWVIRVFNDNLPYDRFIVEQLAGDLLPEATEQQRIATGFCRMHNINDEGGALDEEYRVEAVCDRIETIATTLMGLTFTCSRCHDHKYDPITQDDYYSLYAFFNSIDERGVYPNDTELARAYPARLAYRPAELAARTDAARVERDAAEAALRAAEPTIATERAQWEWALRSERGVRWVDTQLLEATAESGKEMRPQPDGSVRALDCADRDSHTLRLRADAQGLRLLRFEALADATLPKGSIGLAEHGNAVISAITAEAVSVRDPSRRERIEWNWAWADHEQGNGDFGVANVLTDDERGWALDGHVRTETRTALLQATRPFGFAGGTDVTVTIAYRSKYARHVVGRPRVTLAQSAVDLRPDFPVVASDWWSSTFTGGDFDAVYDRAFAPETEAFTPRGEGWKHRPDLVDGKVNALQGERTAFYFARQLRAPQARRLALSLGSDDAIRVFLNGREVLANKAQRPAMPDQEKVELDLQAGDNTLLVKIVNNGGPAGFYARFDTGNGAAPLEPVALIPPALRPEALARRYADEWSERHSTTYAELATRARQRAAALADLDAQAVPVLVMKELDAPTPTHVLQRGRYDMTDETRPVHRRPPMLFGGKLPEGAPDNRLGFARWLVTGDHPLTARVHVNRLWQMLFGTGIVASTENFGQQADRPSNLPLLDWLAVRLVQSGWDQKALLRLIVTSATYRQSATTAAAARAVDPANAWLAWFPRRRLAGELVRDQALFVSGLLVDRLGGPSVKPYQPGDLWKEVSIGESSNTQIFKRDDGEALYRRSLYTFWKRTSPNPQMSTFDAPTREFCVVRRNPTNTPLQALVLWNDPQFVEAARVLAQRTLAEAASNEARLTLMFRRCTGRPPDAAEIELLRKTLAGFSTRYESAPADAAALLTQGDAALPEQYDAAQLAAWTMIANTLLSLDATIVRS